MATHDDFDGVYFTIQALRLYHDDSLSDVEFVIVDNDPDGPSGDAVRQFARSVDACRYVPFVDFTGTCVKNIVFREARSEIVLCVDSHVLVFPGAIRQLLEFFAVHKQCNDLVQGPLVFDGLREMATHWDLQWCNGHFGLWGFDARGASPGNAPFEVEAQGMGLFACRRRAWPGFSPRFAGFGWEEGYIHEKFRRAGRRTLCLPFLRWTHRFGPHPKGVSYPLSWTDRVRNLLIGHWELGLDPEPVRRHFSEFLGPEEFAKIAAEVDDEMSGPFFAFEMAYYVDADLDALHWDEVRARLKALGVHRPRRFLDGDPTKSRAANRMAAHRAIVELARDLRIESVIVFEDVAAIPANARQAVAESVERLRRTKWTMFAIVVARGGNGHADRRGPKSRDELVAGTCAIAYHRRAFAAVLDRLPSPADEPTGTLECRLRGAAGSLTVCRLAAGPAH